MNAKIKIQVMEKVGRKDTATMNYDVDHSVSLMVKPKSKYLLKLF